MNNTANLDLQVFSYETDTTQSFIKGLAGEDVNSNMQKIDDAIGGIYFDINTLKETTSEFSHDLISLQSETQSMRSDIYSLESRVTNLENSGSGGGDSGGSGGGDSGGSSGGDSGGSSSSTVSISNQNLLLNGKFNIYERYKVSRLVENEYFMDRWKTYPPMSTGLQIRRYDGDEAGTFIMDVYTTDSAEYTIGQTVEIPSNGTYTFTLSFEAYTDAWMTDEVMVNCELRPSADERSITQSYGITEDWQKYVFTFKDVQITEKLLRVILMATNSSSECEDATIYYRNVKLEYGENATPDIPVSYDEELRKCQRYFYKYNNTRDSYVKFAHMFTSLGVLIYTDSHVQNLRANPTAVINTLDPKVAVGNSEYAITVTSDSNNQCLHMSCTEFTGFEDGRAYIIKNMPSLDAELYD